MPGEITSALRRKRHDSDEVETLWETHDWRVVTLVEAGTSHDYFVEQDFGDDVRVRIYRRRKDAPAMY